MKLICLIEIVFSLGNVNFVQKEQVEGVLLKNDLTSEYYLVDFSKEAKDKQYIGDYSKKLVKKENCVEL
jgi:hypothetical protein